MSQKEEKKCCEKCIYPGDPYNVPGKLFRNADGCIDPDCPCHSAPTDKSGWEEKRNKLVKDLFSEIDAIASEDDHVQYILSEEEIHKIIDRIESLSDTQGYERGRIAGLKEALEGLPEDMVSICSRHFKVDPSCLICAYTYHRNETLAQVRDTINRKLQK